MGFNLELFFDELLFILNNNDIDEIDKLNMLEECIKEEQKYAKECGML